MAGSPHILQLQDLAIGYGKTILHKELTCSVHAGEVLVILGRNGSGKSTLLRSITALQKPAAGEVLVDGKNLHNISKQQLSKIISVVLTGNRQHAGMLTVNEIFALSRAPHTGWIHSMSKQDEDIIQKAIDFFDLKLFNHRKLFSLSDGELQKVMIARAFVQQTDIIALDEPTSHLDIFNRAEIFSDLKSLAKNFGKSIIVATHEIELGLQLADKVLLLNTQGQHAAGTIRDILQGGEVERFFSAPGFYFDVKTLRFIATAVNFQ